MSKRAIVIWSVLLVLICGGLPYVAAPRPNQTVSDDPDVTSDCIVVDDGDPVGLTPCKRAVLHDAARRLHHPADGPTGYTVRNVMRAEDGGIAVLGLSSLRSERLARACDNKDDCAPHADTMCQLADDVDADHATLEITEGQDGNPICTFRCVGGTLSGFIMCEELKSPRPSDPEPNPEPEPDPGPTGELTWTLYRHGASTSGLWFPVNTDGSADMDTTFDEACGSSGSCHQWAAELCNNLGHFVFSWSYQSISGNGSGNCNAECTNGIGYELQCRRTP